MITSKELSLKLKKAGFEKESELIYEDDRLINNYFDSISKRNEYIKEHLKSNNYIYPAYDILNDLCVKYAKEVFGRKWSHPRIILFLLQQNKPIEEVEKYIWDNSILNKNRS